MSLTIGSISLARILLALQTAAPDRRLLAQEYSLYLTSGLFFRRDVLCDTSIAPRHCGQRSKPVSLLPCSVYLGCLLRVWRTSCTRSNCSLLIISSCCPSTIKGSLLPFLRFLFQAL